jgi:hypothetical protein
MMWPQSLCSHQYILPVEIIVLSSGPKLEKIYLNGGMNAKQIMFESLLTHGDPAFLVV